MERAATRDALRVAGAIALALALLTPVRGAQALAPVPGAVETLQVAAVLPRSPSDRPPLTPVWLDLQVNGVARGARLMLLGAEGEVWVAAEELVESGLKLGREGERIVEPGGRSMVTLRSLAPDLSFQFDERALVVRIEARQELLGERTFDLTTKVRPKGLVRRDSASAFLNWSALADSSGATSGTFELGASVGPALLLSGAMITKETGFVRGLTSIFWDDERRLLRHGLGDLVAVSTDPLGGSVPLLGLGSWREFSLDPYFQVAPLPRATMFSPTPGVLEVWVNDTLVRRSAVLPGTINVENIPINAGSSDVRTVLKDAFGRESSASTYELLGSTALAPGLLDWGGWLGLERRAVGTSGVEYADPVLLGRIRGGLRPWLTLGGRIEGSPSLLSGGGSSTFTTKVGELETGVAASRSEGLGGAALHGAWRLHARRATVALGLRLESDHYANLSLSPNGPRALARASVTTSLPIVRGVTLLADVAGERYRDGGEGIRAGLRAAWLLPRWRATLSAGLYGGRSTDSAGVVSSSGSFSVFLNVPFLERHSASIGGSQATGGASPEVRETVQRSMATRGTDFGWRLSTAQGASPGVEADLQGQNQFGRAEAYWERSEASANAGHGHVRVSSGLVLMDGRLFVTQPIEQSFAIMKVPGAPAVRVFNEGQPVGRTDERGEIFVPGLVPYAANRMIVKDSDLPLHFKIVDTTRYVAPRYRGGLIDTFEVWPVTTLTGKVLLSLDEKLVAPEWGEIAVELPTGRVVSPVGTDGSFWLEDLTPGRHEALVRWEGRLCRMTFDVPDKPGVIDVGTQQCAQMLASTESASVGSK